MEISGISTAVSTSQYSSSSSARADFQRLERSDSAREARHDHGHHAKGRRGHAMGVFKQELRMALKAHFHMRFAAMHHGYSRLQEPASSDDVAKEALGAAKQLVAEKPVEAAKSLISFRAKVHETASYVRETVSDKNDIAEVDDAVAKVDQGLVKLEDKVAANRESSASVLAVDTRNKQRSTIRIRTQEGDVVKMSLKRVDQTTASDVAYQDGDTSVTSTEVAVSNRSRMILKVEGDLNESEMAAIQNVFAQAESIAGEFFGGDIATAFNIAQGLEYDTEQLARVNMRFKMRQMTNVAYAESVRATPMAPPAEPAPEVSTPAVVAPPAVNTRPVAEPEPVINTRPVAEPRPAVEAAAPAPAEVQPADEPVVAEPAATPDTSALASFFDTLGAFLRSVGEGFSAESSSASFQYHYSESFKLELLKSVLHTVAPDDSADAAMNAELVIDSIANGVHHEDD